MSDAGRLRRPTLLTPAHRVDAFDCGKRSLNVFLQRFALENQKSGKSRTYVATRDDAVTAYYSLALGSIAPAASIGSGHKGAGAPSSKAPAYCA